MSDPRRPEAVTALPLRAAPTASNSAAFVVPYIAVAVALLGKGAGPDVASITTAVLWAILASSVLTASSAAESFTPAVVCIVAIANALVRDAVELSRGAQGGGGS